MKPLTRNELTEVLREETERFNKNPEPKYVQLLREHIKAKVSTLENSLNKKLENASGAETLHVLEETLKQLEKIYVIL